ncbi:MAG: NAD(P)-dependent glycerol-3-phosphate dehydrogenase [Nitrospirae bacterium]|nr:NAD(P)-dependent glycerol-3-phosphate dehydrogenase [Nitrospirota bacterium]
MGHIAVIGAGSWGTTLASLIVEKGYEISLWAYEKEVADEINSSGTNNTYLLNIALPKNLKATNSLENAFRGARYILNVVPAQFTRVVFKEAAKFIPKDSVIVSASKGIEKGTLLTVSMILKELSGHEAAVLSGPSFAKEVIKKLPTAVTVATNNHDAGLHIQKLLNTDYFRVYTHDDILGVELGGALKNVIAIASGISDGLRLGFNARASLITRGLAEVTRLGVAMGAKEKTFRGLSGLGDLVLTCTGPLSRNYSVGVKLGQGLKLKNILSDMSMVAEGVSTVDAAYDLSKKYNVEMPIVEQIYKVVNEGKNPADAVRELMRRSLRPEF